MGYYNMRKRPNDLNASIKFGNLVLGHYPANQVRAIRTCFHPTMNPESRRVSSGMTAQCYRLRDASSILAGVRFIRYFYFWMFLDVL